MILTIQYLEKRKSAGPQYYKAYLGSVHIATITYSLRDDEHYIVKWALSYSPPLHAETKHEAKELVKLKLDNWLHSAGIRYEQILF